MRTVLRLCLCGVVVVCAHPMVSGQGKATDAASPRAPVPVEPVRAILDAFRTCAVVGISAEGGTGDTREIEFITSLIRDPMFTSAPTDVVMEGASGRYQDDMDRYVRGEEIAHSVLRHVWDDTTQPLFLWTGQIPPIYRLIRDRNAALARDHQLRILLADPPIDWDTVHTPAEYMKWLDQRDTFPADLVRRETLARGRRALVLFGSGHLQRRNQVSNYDMDVPQAQTMFSLLQASGVSTFVVRVAGERTMPDVGMQTWPSPSIALLRGTTLGAMPEPQGSLPRMAVRDNQLVPVPREEWRNVRLEDQVDAVLYVGPVSPRTRAAVPPEVCADKAYMDTRLKRMALAGLPPSEANRLKDACKVQAP